MRVTGTAKSRNYTKLTNGETCIQQVTTIEGEELLRKYEDQEYIKASSNNHVMIKDNGQSTSEADELKAERAVFFKEN